MFRPANKPLMWAALLGILPVLAAEPPLQSAKSFEQAIRDHSTAQPYVLITVVEEKSGKAQTGCTKGAFLVGAIATEHNLTRDKAGFDLAESVALAVPSHVYHFYNRAALENVSLRYSPSDAEAARKQIRALADEQLREGFKVGGTLQPEGSIGVRDAMACALIERGYSVRMGDRTADLILEP